MCTWICVRVCPYAPVLCVCTHLPEHLHVCVSKWFGLLGATQGTNTSARFKKIISSKHPSLSSTVHLKQVSILQEAQKKHLLLYTLATFVSFLNLPSH